MILTCLRCPARRNFVVMSLFAALTAVALADDPKSAPEHWKGAVMLPGQLLDVAVAFTSGAAADSFTATLDIPIQGVNKAALIDVKYGGDDIAFTLGPPANAVFEMKRAADGKTAEGFLKQGGMSFPVKLQRCTAEEAAAVGPARPQTPKPPFPYTQRELTYENPADHTKLAGTLTIPNGPGPYPAVILITGSGPQDRDESLLGHKPFLVIADHLTRNGIAVLRVDDRGVGGSTGSVANATAPDSVGDVLAGVAELKKQPEIDAKRVGLVGHSEGGLLAPMVAAKSADIKAIVLLAGTGLPGRDILIMQLAKINASAGVPADNITRQTAAQTKLLDALGAKADEATLKSLTHDLVVIQTEGAQLPSDATEREALLSRQVDGALATINTPWFRSFIPLDPRIALRQVKCPVLALNGELDTQVPPDENLSEIAKALKEAGNPDVTTRKFDKLNHLFQEATTGSPQEYAVIQQTMAPVVLEEMTKWLRERFGVSGAPK